MLPEAALSKSLISALKRILTFLCLATMVARVSAMQEIWLPLSELGRAVKLDSIGMMTPVPLNEASGMARSRVNPEFVWVQNDSGGAARLMGFSIPDPHHYSWGSEYYQLFVENAVNHDWEDLMMGSDGMFYIADTGNNLKRRETLTLLRVIEPAALTYAQSVSAERIDFRYASPEGFEPFARRDCEAICEYAGGILLFTKRLSNANCDVFYLPNIINAPVRDEILTASFLFRIRNFRGVTAADTWMEEGLTRIAVLSYGLVWVWDMPVEDLSSNLLQRVLDGRGFKIKAGLCETLTFEKRDSLIISNEGRKVFRVRIE